MPTIEEALQIGWKQHQAGNVRGAEDIYRQVLNVAPSNENAWCFLGMACHDQGRYDEAAQAYREAIRIKPNFPVALSNFGNTLKQQGKLEEAEASCKKALEYKPDYSTAFNNLGVVLVAQGRLEEAAKVFEKSLQLVPQDVVAQSNLGAALVRQGKFEEGTEISQRALKINPNYAEAHKNQAIVWLLLGDFDRGWPEYEWRWKCPGSALPNVPGPRWDGSPLDGKTILLHWEQGLGDTVHFVRYARRLKQQGARVVVCCQKPLKPLLAWCEGIDELVAAGEPLPRYDFWTPLLSIPGILKTTLDTIPGDTGYITADPERVKYWRQRLSEFHGYRVGIAWQGSPDFHADRHRSIPLKHFERLARIPGVRLVSLQKGYGTEQLGELAGKFEVIDFGKELDESGPFLDTAAIIQCVDLVVSSDTCLPHLASSLGAPTWMGLSVSPDWRWLLHREDSPWYPTMRIFRQQKLGDWDTVFERIADELKQRMAHQETLTTAAAPEHSIVAPDLELESSAVPENVATLKQTGFGTFIVSENDAAEDQAGTLVADDGEASLVVRLVDIGDTVADIDAGAGHFTVLLAQQVGPAGTVYAYEPDRWLFLRLCGNIAVNGLRNVQPYSPTAWIGESSEMQVSDKPEENRKKVIESLSGRDLRLIKLEAADLNQVPLESVKKLLASEPVAYLPGIENTELNDVMTRLRPLGYSFYRLRAENATLDQSDSKSPVVGERSGVICVPGRHAARLAEIVSSSTRLLSIDSTE